VFKYHSLIIINYGHTSAIQKLEGWA